MERKEPSLVPEWLKGGAGGGAGGALPFSHPSFHQDGSGRLNSPSHRHSKPDTADNFKVWDSNLSPYGASERELHVSLRRPASSRGGLIEKSNADLGAFSRSKSSLSGYSILHHKNESSDRDLLSRAGEHGWTSERDRSFRELGRDRASAFSAFNGKDKDPEPSELSGLHSLNSGLMTRQRLPLRRVQSMVASHGINEEGEETAFESLDAHAGSSSTTGSLQKAPFDGLCVASTRASTPPALISAASESIFSVREAEGKYADLSGRSHLTGSNNTSTRETMSRIAEEPSLTRNVTPLRPTLETLRLEEVELRQSRQLVPMKPSFPRTMVSSPREKLKPKVTRAADIASSILPKGTQALSQATSSGHRLIVQNKPTVWRSNKEVITSSIISNAGTEKLDGNSVTFSGSLGGKLLVDPAGISQSTGANAKPKQLLDKRTVPLSSPSLTYGVENGPTQRPKELGAVVEDKRISVQAKKRTDFFNALRKKAAESGHSQSNFVSSDSIFVDKTEEASKSSELDVSLSSESDTATNLRESGTIDNKDHYGHGNTKSSDSTVKLNIIAPPNNHDNCVLNHVSGVIAEDGDCVMMKSPVDNSDKASDAATNSEEEEEAFMRSLGWEDNVEEEEALTEEEISAFYEQYGEFLTNKSRIFQHKQSLNDFVVRLSAETLGGSISSDVTSSETDSAGELNVQ